MRRGSFGSPDDFSSAVSDIYRAWHCQRAVLNRRLLLDPLLIVRTGSVPFWLTFNMRLSLLSAYEYLRQVGSFEEMRLMLFSYGTNSIGLAAMRKWR